MQFMLVNDGWRGGDMRKYDKDTSVSQADALGRSPALREGRRVKITRRISRRYVEKRSQLLRITMFF